MDEAKGWPGAAFLSSEQSLAHGVLGSTVHEPMSDPNRSPSKQIRDEGREIDVAVRSIATAYLLGQADAAALVKRPGIT